MLRSTHYELSDHSATLSVAETLITNLKFNSIGRNKESYSLIRPKIEVIGKILEDLCISPTIVTLDALLSVACTIGSYDDIDQALFKYSTFNLTYSQYTFNTLLNRYANDANTTAAFSLLEQMQGAHVDVDITTLNTLVKLFIKVKNLEGIKKVFK